MKKISTISFGILVAMASTAQVIPNASFETWMAGAPQGWTVNNNAQFNFITESNDAHAGSKAVRINSFDLGGFVLAGIINADNVPQTSFPQALKGWYKGELVGGDQFFASATFNSASSAIVGAAAGFATESVNMYTEFTADVNILSAGPATVSLSFTIFNPGGTSSVDSFVLLDDLSWDGTSVEEYDMSAGFALEQVMPNPVTGDACMVQYRLDHNAAVDMVVYDLQGKQVMQVVQMNQGAGHYRAELNTSSLEAGYYVVACTVDGVRKTLPLVKH